MSTLDPDQDRRDLDTALRDYEAGVISLAQLRAVAETIVDRWRDRSLVRPRFTDEETLLWNAVWEVITGCRQSLGDGGVGRLRAILAGEIPLDKGGPQLRP